MFFKAHPEVKEKRLCFKVCKKIKETDHFGGIVIDRTIREAWLCSECGSVAVEYNVGGPLDDIVEKLDRILGHFGLRRY